MENQSKSGFIEIQHTADWAIQVTASSPEQLFKFCVEGMYHLLKAEVDLDSPCVEKNFILDAVDLESLLVTFLSELLFYYETEEILFPSMDLRIHQNQLQAKLSGRRIISFGVEIKAVTYHQMKIEQRPEGLSVIVVFDV